MDARTSACVWPFSIKELKTKSKILIKLVMSIWYDQILWRHKKIGMGYKNRYRVKKIDCLSVKPIVALSVNH